MRVLVIEDNRKVASFLQRGLREEGYSVDLAYDGDDGALKARVYDYDLLIVDVVLPGQSGFEIVRGLRAEEDATPILLLTARDSKADVIMGLDVGADDYLTKPFSFDELLARVRALIRRGGARRQDTLVYHDVELDLRRHTASRKGVRLSLTPKEMRLLEYLLLNREKVVRRSEMLEKVWDLQFDPMSNVVDVHISNLRQKLQQVDNLPLIHTIRGVGFMLSAEPPD